MAKGPPMFKNFSDGAVTAMVLKPPITPAVYHAALINNGPPNMAKGATKAPNKLACKAHASCFEPNVPFSYGIDLTNIPDPITHANDAKTA